MCTYAGHETEQGGTGDAKETEKEVDFDGQGSEDDEPDYITSASEDSFDVDDLDDDFSSSSELEVCWSHARCLASLCAGLQERFLLLR